MDYHYLDPKQDVQSHVRDVTHDEEKGFSQQWSSIVFSCLVMVVPMIVFTGILLGLIFSYQVTAPTLPFKNLQVSTMNDHEGVYYVKLNATLLIFIASWSSSVAPILIGFALTLSSYPIARGIRQGVMNQEMIALPTPYQTALLLQFFDGGSFGALWAWLRYKFSWKTKSREAVALSRAVSIALLAAFLALLVFVTDTWLHIVTKSINLVQITALDSGVDYSFTLTQECSSRMNGDRTDAAEACVLNERSYGTTVQNATIALQLLNNVSGSAAVLTHHQSQTAFLGVPESVELSMRDYTASTFGIETQCRPITTECDMTGAYGASTPFKCSETFSGDVTAVTSAGPQPDWQMAYFTDQEMSSNETYDGVGNPFYFGIATLTNSEGGIHLQSLQEDPEVVTPSKGGLAYVLFCSSTVYDIVYDSVNSNITRFDRNPSNDSTTTIWQAGIARSGLGRMQLQTTASLASLSESAQEIADKMATAYSKVAIAISAGAVTRQPALAAQERTISLVARLPVAPLYTLITANMLFVIMGLVLAISAYIASMDAETREVRARLSIVGLAANFFEGQRAKLKVDETGKLFEEHQSGHSVKIGIDEATAGGHEYKSYSTGVYH